MTRRSVLTLLATLVAWVSVRPKVHADAVKGRLKPAKEPISWRIVLMDGETFVDERLTTTPRRSWIVPCRISRNDPVNLCRTGPHAQDYAETIFTMRQEQPGWPTILTRVYDYESGPKWWTRP